MKKILNFAMNGLAAAANSRARFVMRTLAQTAQPVKVDYRANAGGWN